MAEDTNSTDSVKNEAKGASLPDDIESQIKTTMRSRIAYFKEQSDSLTLESVRRLLEEDLGLEKLALDVHKRLIKNCLLECLHGTGDDNALKSSGEKVDSNVSTTSEMGEPTKGDESKKEVKQPCSDDEEKVEDSPVMEPVSDHKATKTESIENEPEEILEVSEGEIKKAIRKRASYVVANSEEITMAGLRRLLEEDMKLEKHTLDTHKKFISAQIDEVLKSSVVAASSSEVKKNLKKSSQSKAPRKSRTKKNYNTSEDEDEEEEDDDDDEVKRPKGKGSKGASKNSEGPKKRKRSEKETTSSSKKRTKAQEKVSDDDSDAEGGGVVSDDDRSQSSTEKTAKRKEASAPIYGKRVEHLKSVIKSCGMSVPPAIYKKVKQAPENKRESHLIKELEAILSKEGLPPNPSEKEIKDVRKRKDRAKELEGIDTSNIVLSSRRRSTTSFVPPKPPKIADSSSGDDEDDEEEDEDDDDDNEDNDDEEEDKDGGDEANSGSQSEEGTNAEEDEDEDSD